MSTRDALEKARSAGLDLVEIAANADPPVCKITDYGKYCYAQSKLKKNQPKAQARMKEVKFRVRIETNDYNVKLAKAENFLDHGHKLRVQLQFRGREMAHQELGFQLMKRVQADLETMGHIDVPPRHAGRNITMMLSPLPASQRKRKFKLPHEFTAEELAREEADHEDFEDDEDHDGHEDAGADLDASSEAGVETELMTEDEADTDPGIESGITAMPASKKKKKAPAKEKPAKAS